MHRDDRFCPRGNAVAKGSGVEVECPDIDICKDRRRTGVGDSLGGREKGKGRNDDLIARADARRDEREVQRSEEHTSELQSLAYLVCRLLLEKKKNNITEPI